MMSVIRDVFGFCSTQPGQIEAIIPALHGHVFVKMVTGAGKSICAIRVGADNMCV